MEKVKNILMNVFEKMKIIFKNKFVIIGVVIVALISLVVSLVLINRDDKDKFALDPMYDVYPADVRELYTNMVSVSCYGDLHFDINVKDGEVGIDKLNKKYLLDYLFSYLDKEYGLNTSIKENIVKKSINELFNSDVGLFSKINDFAYGEYVYNMDDGILDRKKDKCSSDIKYVSRLFGYSYGNDTLSVDINVGYLKNGVLYDIEDKRLGKYSGNDMEKLDKLFEGVPYYRYNFVKKGDTYKLKSVLIRTRGKSTLLDSVIKK